MLYAFLVLAVGAIALLLLQQYALRKLRGGFSLRDGDKPRKRLFTDPEEERMRQWLESDEGDQTDLFDEGD